VCSSDLAVGATDDHAKAEMAPPDYAAS